MWSLQILEKTVHPGLHVHALFQLRASCIPLLSRAQGLWRKQRLKDVAAPPSAQQGRRCCHDLLRGPCTCAGPRLWLRCPYFRPPVAGSVTSPSHPFSLKLSDLPLKSC